MKASNAQKLSIRKNTIQNLPAKCKLYIGLLLSLQQEKTLAAFPKALRKKYQYFTDAFKTLNQQERHQFISKNIEHATQSLNGNCHIPSPNICDIETTCQMKAIFLKMTFWEKRTLKYEYNFQRIKLTHPKKQELIDLKSYLVRRSNSQKNSLVLECFDPNVSQKFQKISLRFTNSSICKEIFNCIRESIVHISFKRIQLLLADDINQEKTHENHKTLDLNILTPHNIAQFFENKPELSNKLRKSRIEVFGIYSRNGITILNSSYNSKCYYLEYNLPKQCSNIAHAKEFFKVIEDASLSKSFVCEKLERSSAVTANYYRINAGGEDLELIMIVQRKQSEEMFKQTMKSTNNIYFGINVVFIEVLINKSKNNLFTVQINTIIKKSKNKKSSDHQQTIIKFLLQLVKPKQGQFADLKNKSNDKNLAFSRIKKSNVFEGQVQPPRSRSVNRQSFIESTIKQVPLNCLKIDDANSSQQDQEFYSIQDIQDLQQLKQMQQLYHSISSKMVQQFTQKSNYEERIQHYEENLYMSQRIQNQIKSYLQARHPTGPTLKQALKLITEHNLLVDWKKSSKGGVICINKQAIQEQKRVVKLAFNQIGTKIFKLKGIINFSLPIQICRCESSLVSLARNISYAPLLLQNAKQMSPLQRMKKMITLQISWCSLALSTQKPFNPILGQTYQGFINGCPVYMQQVSHHPPISYMYFIGRGYKIYGQVALVLSVRLNYLKGVSEQFMTIEFDNGRKCQMSISGMVINGLIFGERTVYFQGTNYVIDYDNDLIAQIRYNAKNNGSIFKSKENVDFFMGQIFQVTSSFMEKFIASNKKLSPKKDENNRIKQTFSGQWNGTLIFNNQKVYDFQSDLPLMLEDYEFPILSDQVYREDIINRKLGDMIKGQEEKQRLEQLQRADKKLRNRFKQQNKKK